MRDKNIIVAASITASLVLALSIAFAALATNLNISFGNVTQNALTWNVGFKGSSVTPIQEGTSNTGLSCGGATVTPSTVTIADSTLSKPNDKCTYALTIENTGDVSANLSAITMSQPTNMSCVIKDEATMECGNITIKLKTESGVDFTSGVTIEPKEEYELSLIIEYTGTELNSTETTISSSKVTFAYTQSAKRASSAKPDGIKKKQSAIACKRATTLHTEECVMGSTDYCKGAGYSETGSRGTSTITYGNYGTTGTLSAGDAFDCDVNNDGVYDSETERFYYVSRLNGDDTSNYAVLAYYTNVKNGEPYYSSSCFGYHADGWCKNYIGPVSLLEHLPTTSQWSNVSLTNQKRQIYNELGTTTTATQQLPIFEYTDRAARLLTVQEVNKACNITIGNDVPQEFRSCEYLLEHGYWANGGTGCTSVLENAYSGNDTYVWALYTAQTKADKYYASNNFGAKPAIEVPISRIEY